MKRMTWYKNDILHIDQNKGLKVILDGLGNTRLIELKEGTQ